MLTVENLEQYHRDGYFIARGLFSQEEVAFFIEHYMKMRHQQSYPGDFAGVPVGKSTGDTYLLEEKPDPLKQYPRMIHMHRWDDVSLRWLIDSRLNEYLTAFLGVEPYATQTMLYFKPAGARGQALHQDQFYLKAKPGTCMAAWMALDDCDEENGCLQVVPGSHNWDLLCAIPADTTTSFTDVTVPLPEGVKPVPAIMKAGDVLFFNGQVVHGSFPNTSKDRFRRSLIGHYVTGTSQQVAQFYHPVLNMRGEPVTVEVSQGGGACGVWVDRNGQPVIEMQAVGVINAPDHE